MPGASTPRIAVSISLSLAIFACNPSTKVGRTHTVKVDRTACKAPKELSEGDVEGKERWSERSCSECRCMHAGPPIFEGHHDCEGRGKSERNYVAVSRYVFIMECEEP